MRSRTALFEHKEAHDAICIGAVLWTEAAAAHGLEIGIDEGLRRLCLPNRKAPLNGFSIRPGQIRWQRWFRRCGGVGQGAEHAGDVARSGVLCAAFRKRTQRLALEINYDRVPAGD